MNKTSESLSKELSSMIEQAAESGLNTSSWAADVTYRFVNALQKTVFQMSTPGTVVVESPAMDKYGVNDKLEVMNAEGKMEIAISASVLRGMLPKEAKNLKFSELQKMAREGKFDGFLYRIPTQGKNFAAPYTIKHLLPNSAGKSIMTPIGWTIKSGAD